MVKVIRDQVSHPHTVTYIHPYKLCFCHLPPIMSIFWVSSCLELYLLPVAVNLHLREAAICSHHISNKTLFCSSFCLFGVSSWSSCSSHLLVLMAACKTGFLIQEPYGHPSFVSQAETHYSFSLCVCVLRPFLTLALQSQVMISYTLCWLEAYQQRLVL